MSLATSCPACGLPLGFAYDDTRTVVCDACRAVVVRDLGAPTVRALRVSEPLVPGASVLALRTRGTFRGRRFTLVGAAQFRHELGGLWTEWVVAYDEPDVVTGRFAWLAEHEGMFDLTTAADLAVAPPPRRTADVVPGENFQTPSGEWTVVERGRTTVVALLGELPDLSEPESRRPYIDFAGPAGAVATLDLGELAPSGREGAPRFFVGVRVALADLGIVPVAASAEAVNGDMPPQCPSCYAELVRRLPQAQSVVCAKCHTAVALDGEGGAPRLLFKQERLKFQPALPLGTTVTLAGLFFARAGELRTNRPWPRTLDVTVVGYVVKSVVVDGETFFFEEFLLDAGAGDTYWIVQTDGDWYFTRRVDTHLVKVHGSSASLEGTSFTFKEGNRATTVQVLGEHPYAPIVGETAEVADFVAQPRMLSKEVSPDEIVWTESLQIPRDVVAGAFGVRLRGTALSATGSSGGGGSGAKTTAPTATTFFWIFVLIIVVIILATQCDGGGCGFFGRGGGFSFGK